MAVNKNFVVKNGIEVGSSLIVASAESNTVGVGTTVGQFFLDVRGSIGATDLSVSGVGTIVTLNSTNFTGTSGTITTLTSTNGTITYLTGTSSTITNSDITNLTGTAGTITTLTSTNATITNGDITNLTGTAGTITTLTSTNGNITNINVSGLSTFVGVGTFSGDLYVGGDLYVADDLVFDEFTARNINVTGVATATNLDVSENLYVTGITTSAGGFVGNLTGTASTAYTAFNLTNAANITTGTIDSARLSGTYSIDISGNSATSDYATSAGIATQATYATSAGIATYATSAGIATYASTAGIATYATNAGVATYASTAGIATFATSAGVSTNVEGTANRVLYNSATDTTSTSSNLTFDGTTLGVNQLNVSGVSTFVSVDVTNLTPTNINSSGVTTVATLDVQTKFDVYDAEAVFHNNVVIDGDLTVNGTETIINVTNLNIQDKDLVLGIGTAGDPDPTDTSSNHGGIAVASTEGTPLVPFKVAGINTLPDTYKQFMWTKGGTYGVGTADAWLSNYAVGVGSTLVPTGVVFAAGGIQFTDSTITTPTVTIGAGIVTAASGIVTYYGDGQYLTNVVSGVGISTEGGNVGYGATLLDFRGAGISTITFDSATGISTINITGGGGGGASVSISTVAPSSPSGGDLWYSPDHGKTFIYYDETAVGYGTDSYWVDAAPFNIGISSVAKLSFADGTASSPSIYFADDSQTGWFSPTNGEQTFVSSGSSILNVNSSGIYVSGNAASATVGLGTTNANTTLDFSQGNNFSLTLTGSIVLANPTGFTTGQSGIIEILQDGTGSRTCGFGSHWDFPSATPPTLSTGANALDVITYFVRSSTSIVTNSLIGIGTL